MPKNAQATTQFSLISHASKVMLKILQARQLHGQRSLVGYSLWAHKESDTTEQLTLSLSGFNSMWTENFQMYKLDFEKAEEPGIKMPTLVGSQRKQGNSRKTSTSVSLIMLQPLTVWIITNCGKFLKRLGILDHLTCLLRNLYLGQEETEP